MEVKDHRNAKAKARDRFLNSPEGMNLIALSAEGSRDLKYIRNRFKAAFCAGYEAGKNEQEKGIG